MPDRRVPRASCNSPGSDYNTAGNGRKTSVNAGGDTFVYVMSRRLGHLPALRSQLFSWQRLAGGTFSPALPLHKSMKFL